MNNMPSDVKIMFEILFFVLVPLGFFLSMWGFRCKSCKSFRTRRLEPEYGGTRELHVNRKCLKCGAIELIG